MSYKYETQYNSPNYTPANATRSVWGVDRQIKNIAIHWWGDPAQNPVFENVIAHLCNPASQVSAHYVATGTDRQVACLVSPDDNSWSTMSDNPYCISIECDPRCRDEDYDVVAEVIADIRSAYGDLPLVPHKQFTNTTCPGNWDLGRLDAIARTKVSHDNWGDVTDVNAPAPTPIVPPTPTPTPTPVLPVADQPPVVTPEPAPVVDVPAPVVTPSDTTPSTTTKPWFQPIIDFFVYLVKNIILGVK